MDRRNISLREEVVLVPGASGALGRKVVSAIVQRGGNVVAGCHRNREKLSGFVKERELQQRVVTVEGDLKNSSVRRNYIEAALKKWGRLDGLVDCSGIPCRTSLDLIESKEISSIFDANSFGPLLLARDVAKEIIRLKSWGSVVHISSQHALSLTAGREIYALSKLLLSHFNRMLARQYPSVQFNEIVLGAIGIGMSSATKINYPNHIVSLTQVISAILYLLDKDASEGLTGSVLRLDKGFSLPYI